MEKIRTRCFYLKVVQSVNNTPKTDSYAYQSNSGDIVVPAKISMALELENNRLKQWISDLQSGMYVNCVYCGHRYGPAKDTPVAMADILKKHIEECPEHPLSKAKQLGNAMAEAIESFNNTRVDIDRLKWLQALNKALIAAQAWKEQI